MTREEHNLKIMGLYKEQRRKFFFDAYKFFDAILDKLKFTLTLKQ